MTTESEQYILMESAQIEEPIIDTPEFEKHPLDESLDEYLINFYSRLWMDADPSLDIKSYVERMKGETLHIIETNNKVEDISHSERYIALKDRHKRQRGRCALGLCQCIDGRCSIPHTIGQIGSVWETKAGILATEKSPIDGKLDLESSRLQASIANRAQNSQNGPLLEILVAHTSLHDPDHGCGAMKQRQAENKVPEGTTDLVLENLRIHEESTKVITEIYNRNIRRDREEDILKRASITAVMDTDTMGYVFGYENEKSDDPEQQRKGSLSTTKLVNEFRDVIRDGSMDDYGGVLEAGVYKDLYNKIEGLIPLEENMLYINDILLHNKAYREKIDTYVNANLTDLTRDQQQAFAYFVTRNVAKQYLIGLFAPADHKFSKHEEDYQAISLDGITLGQYDPEHQVFGASPASAEEAIDHVRTQCALMDSIGHAEQPYKLFLSRTVSPNGNMNNERGILRKTFIRLLQNDDIKKRVKEGDLALIPIFIDSKTRKIIEIPNFGR